MPRRTPAVSSGPGSRFGHRRASAGDRDERGSVLYIATGRGKMAFTLDTATNTVVGSVGADDRPV